MGFRRSVCLVIAAAALGPAALGGCGEGGGAGAEATPGPSFDGRRAYADVARQVELGPRPAGSAASRRLTRQLARGLEQAGVQDVRIQSPQRNVVGTIPGTEPGYIVLGAHHDTKDVPPILGANDGASGVAVVLELARALPGEVAGPSIAIALFDGEEARGGRDFLEDGLRGSRQYVSYAESGRQDTPPLEQIEAMLLFDMVGDCDLQIPFEPNSDPGLYARFQAAAGGAPFEGSGPPISDDHLPFVERGIPALDLIDFSFGPGPAPGRYWHTTDDTLEKVCPESLAAVGEAALAAIPRIGRGV